MGDGFNDDCAVVRQIRYLCDPATIDNLPEKFMTRRAGYDRWGPAGPCLVALAEKEHGLN